MGNFLFRIKFKDFFFIGIIVYEEYKRILIKIKGGELVEVCEF